MNPNGTIPILQSGIHQVIVEGAPLFDWVLDKEKSASKLLLHKEQEKNIETIQRYFFREIRGITSQLIRRLALRVLSPERAPKPTDSRAQEKLTEMMYIFESQLLPRLDQEISGSNKFLTGPKMSVVDIIIYCEVSQIFCMYRTKVPSSLKKLEDWYAEIGGLDAIRQVDAELEQVLDNFKLREKFRS